MVRPNSWMLTLSQLIRTDTFIAAGTTLEEIDVEYYLEQRSQKTIRKDVPPSIFIEAYPNRLTEILCDSHEFCLFHGSIFEFFSELEKIDARLKSPWIDKEKDGLAGLGLSQADRLKFSASFEIIPDDPEAAPNPARFLLGAELTWSMLAANTDVPRDVFPRIRGDLLRALDDHQRQIVLLIDEPGSGKTAFMKRLALDLSRGSDNVFWYSGLGLELEHRAVSEIFNSINGPTLVFVDNFADGLNIVSLVLENITKPDILFVCAERDYRLSYIENAFTGYDYIELKGMLALTKDEASRLRSLYVENGLSTIQDVSESRYIGQVVGKTIAEASCRIQNNFKTLDRIVNDLMSDCEEDETSTYLLVSLARFCYSIGVRRNVLSTISYSDAVEYLLSDSASLPIKYSDHDASFVIPKQALVGDRMIEIKRRDARSELFKAFCDLATAIAPRVNPKTIRRRTPEAQILGRLMDYDNNIKRFIDDYAEEYYLVLKPLCDWNSRYWEQMSLLKLDRFFASPDDKILLEESIQHARSAISAEVHPFSLTTLAKVLFQAMERSPAIRDELFSEAWNNIVEANERESRWANRGATLFVVCFGGVLSYLGAGGQLTGEQYEYLRDMVSETHRLKVKDRRLRDLREKLSDAI